MARVAILILNYNGVDHLRRFLPSIILYSDKYDIIVGDNGSTDNSIKVLQDEFKEVEIIKLKNNFGYAEGYNQLIGQIDHEYIALVNSDIEATPGWAKALINTLDSDPDVAAVQPKILSYTDRNKFEYAGAAGGFIDKYGYPYCRGRIFNTLEEDLGQYDDPLEVFWASGACFMIRREAFINAGEFDGDFFAHMEEIDLCWRFQKLGYKVLFNPKSTVYHLGGGTLDYQNPRKTYLNYRNNWSMLVKNLTEKKRKLITRWFMDILSIFLYLLKFQFGNVMAVIKAHYYILANRKHLHNKKKSFKERHENLKDVQLNNASIVWEYFVKRKKKFSELVPH
ncbi:MAG: glycosyltransferase family 2 protein [Bacteroidota bacterium]